ncbi:hypothetical protein BH11PSE11_BH11PSE11_30810 [soil metagenome]
MYLSHFGLNQSPFGITPNPVFFYSGSKRGDILEALIYAVTHGEGIVKVTGEVGSGKTMLCRMLESMMPANVEVIYLVNPTLSREEVVFAIAGELEIVTTGKRPDEVIRLLQNDLIAKHVAGKQVVLLVEEAQAMPLDTLEEIRLFSNLETAHHKLLQIVLFGQPELDENLNLPRMRQLKERITHSFKVPPMTVDVIPEFLMFRMRAAGYHGPDVFSKGAIKLLAGVSEGIVRRINILADKALLAAFADNTHSIEQKHMKAAIDDSEFAFASRSRPKPNRNLFIGLAITAVVVIAADIGWRTYAPNPIRVPQPVAAGTVPARSTAPEKLEPTPAKAAEPAPAVPGMVPIPVAAQASNGATAPGANVIDTAGANPAPGPAATTGVTAAATPPISAPVTPAASERAVPAPTSALAPANPPAGAASKSSSLPFAEPAATSAAMPAKAADASAVSAKPVSGLLQERVAASKQWLQTGDPDHYTIQLTLAGAGDPARLERILKDAAVEVGIEQLHLYPTRIGGLPRLGVVYSSFATREEARLKRIELARKWDYRAQLRTIRGLRSEMQRQQSESLWPG